MSTRAQEEILKFLNEREGKRPVAKSYKQPAADTGSEPPRRVGFQFSGQTMEQLAKRREQETEVAEARVEKSGEKVDKEAMRRDILGRDRAAKLRAQTKFRSTNLSREKYVKVADRI